MENKLDYISVKDLKRGDYTYNEIDTDEGTFGYVSIFEEITEEDKFAEIVAAGSKMPKGYEDDYDALYYNTKGVIPTRIRFATDDEKEYLNRLLRDDDGKVFSNGKLRKF